MLLGTICKNTTFYYKTGKEMGDFFFIKLRMMVHTETTALTLFTDELCMYTSE